MFGAGNPVFAERPFDGGSAAVSRRRFLSSIAAPALLGARAPQRGRARPRDPIVVVGAGLAGLHTARLLRGAGQPVVVLEARGGPGGRVRTVRPPFSDGLYGEAGAIRISGAHRRVLQLARDHRLSLMPFAAPAGSPVVKVAGLTLRSPDELGKAAGPLRLRPEEAGLTPGELLNRYAGDLPGHLGDESPPADARAAWRAYDRVTWPEWLESRGASAGAIRLMTVGGDSRGLSALYVLRQIALLRPSSQFYKIEGGMDRLPGLLAAWLADCVRYRAEVVRLDQQPGAVAVTYRERDRTTVIRASRVVVAIPFSTLKHVRISPALPAEQAQAVEELSYFPAARFLLQVRTRVWEAQDLSGSARTDDPAEIWDAAYEQPGPGGVLGATTGGAIGDALTGMAEPEALRFAVDLVARTFPRVRAAVQQVEVVQWARDAWARGAFAVFRPGQMSGWPDLARARGRLHFAGEHTSPWMSWMEGALESGERAAREVLALT